MGPSNPVSRLFDLGLCILLCIDDGRPQSAQAPRLATSSLRTPCSHTTTTCTLCCETARAFWLVRGLGRIFLVLALRWDCNHLQRLSCLPYLAILIVFLDSSMLDEIMRTFSFTQHHRRRSTARSTAYHDSCDFTLAAPLYRSRQPISHSEHTRAFEDDIYSSVCTHTGYNSWRN